MSHFSTFGSTAAANQLIWRLANLRPLTLVSLIAAGVNACIDTGFRAGLQHWSQSTTVGTLSSIGALASGIRYRELNITSWNPANGAVAYFAALPQRTLRVSPGQRVEGRGLVGGTSGMVAQIRVAWLNEAGSHIATSTLQGQTLSLAGGGAQSTYHEIGGFATAPSDAAWAVLYFQFIGGSSGTIQHRIAAPFIARARDGQTAPTPIQINNDYTPGADPTALFAMTMNPRFPLSSTSSTSIAVAAVVVMRPGETFSLPSATISGLVADTNYAVFRDLVSSVYVAASSGLDTYATNLARYLPIGIQRTELGAGGFSPPPSPPSGGGGGGSGGQGFNWNSVLV
jgi:hypothetical protein